jgi:hypothetical protein
VCRKPVNSRTTRAEQLPRAYPRVVSRHHQRVFVSVGTAACLVFAALASALVGSHGEAPAYALFSSVVSISSGFLATLGGSYLVLAVVVRGVIRGELPSTISKEGVTWAETAASGTDDAIAALQAQVDKIGFDVQELSRRVAVRYLP